MKLFIAGVACAWFVYCIWPLLRYLMCDCAERMAKYGDIEIPLTWNIEGCSYGVCRHGRRYMHWKDYCAAEVEEKE